MITLASDRAENFPNEKFGRPFCLMLLFWGQRYRDYFVDLCLPSLLAPNNLPLLNSTDGHRLLIATTAEDWAAIKDLPGMRTVRDFVTPTLIEISNPLSETAPGSSNAITYQNECLKKLLDAGYSYGGYGSLLSPDCIVPNGMIASLGNFAAAGHHLVLSPALRQVEESVLAEMHERGMLRSDKPLALTGEALIIPPRELAGLAVRHLHPEVAVFEGSSPDWPFAKPYWFWRVPGGDGLILRSHYGVATLMDYSILETHNIACLDHDMFENIYLSSNFYRHGGIHVVQDSDEFVILSVTPASVCQKPVPGVTLKPLSKLDPCFSVRVSMGAFARRAKDPLKRDIFRYPVRWHSGNLDEVWMKAERVNSEMIQRAVGDYFDIADNVGRYKFPTYFTINIHRFPAELVLLWFENARFRQVMRPIQLLVTKLARMLRSS